jgi:DnaB helicase-like protein
VSEIFNDPAFQDELLRFMAHDREFLKTASHLLTLDDFGKVEVNEGLERNLVGRLSLNFWNHYREPIGKLLKVETLEYIQEKQWNDATKKRIMDYVDECSASKKRIAGDAVLQKVRRYKTEFHLAKGLNLMTDLVMKGTITQEQFMQIAREAVDGVGKEAGVPIDIFSNKELENRISRRILQQKRQRFPVLLIDPLDRMVRIIARKHMGLVLAPYKRGKTLFFIWLALAYTLQGLNVMFFTLEDPVEDIEDRFDAAITSLPISRLVEIPDAVRERFSRYKRLLKSKLKVVDGTDGGITIGALENIWEMERNRGFAADVVIVDYDDEIKPQKKQLERRMEFADIYRDFRAFLARKQCIGWTASQTSRASADLKIISGKHVAEDISKIRKTSMALSLGKGEWGDDSVFLWVAAHRYDRQEVGCNIITNKARGLFYDREATLKEEKAQRKKKKP